MKLLKILGLGLLFTFSGLALGISPYEHQWGPHHGYYHNRFYYGWYGPESWGSWGWYNPVYYRDDYFPYNYEEVYVPGHYVVHHGRWIFKPGHYVSH